MVFDQLLPMEKQISLYTEVWLTKIFQNMRFLFKEEEEEEEESGSQDTGGNHCAVSPAACRQRGSGNSTLVQNLLLQNRSRDVRAISFNIS